MKIPEIRTRLHELALSLDCDELAVLAEATRRAPSVRKRAQRTAQPVTDELAENVRIVVNNRPAASYRDVGRFFGIDGGRVSEIMTGRK